MSKLAEYWFKFWFGPSSSRTLGAVRLALVLVSLVQLWEWWRSLHMFFLPDGALPFPQGFRGEICKALFATKAAATTSFSCAAIIHGIACTRWFKRSSIILLLAWQIIVGWRVGLVSGGPDNAIRIGLFFLAIAPSATASSIMVPRYSIALFQLQTYIIYYCTAYAKLQSIDWLSGRMIGLFFQSIIAVPQVAQLTQFPRCLQVATYGALLIEVMIPLMLTIPRWRNYGIYLGIVFHGTIALVSRVEIFSLAMLAYYFAFINDDCLSSRRQST